MRATDETVPQALSGYRPRVSLTASAGEQYLDSLTKTSAAGAGRLTPAPSGNVGVQSYGGTITQTAAQRLRHRAAGRGRPSNWCPPRARRCG